MTYPQKSGMNFRMKLRRLLVLFLFAFMGSTSQSEALELDWSGQFWSEYNFVHNYPVSGTGIVPGSAQNATFQSLFLRLRPKLVVNDNIYIKSEWWLGDPIFGMFGNSVPYTLDQNSYYMYNSRGAQITAQRYWGEFVTDIGTFQVGRVPLHWGLGIVWNQGENLWDRYMSTGDGVRWIAQFGAFTLIPSFIVGSAGNSIGGGCTWDSTLPTPTCIGPTGMGGVSHYSLIFKYASVEDQFELGANLLKTVGGSGQDRNGGIRSWDSFARGMSFFTYDLFAKKQLKDFTLSAEVPIVRGELGGAIYNTWAAAGEVSYQLTDATELSLKAGYAPGQEASSTTLGELNSFYFNPNYNIAMILFNYQMRNFSQPQTLNNPSLPQNQLKSPYDNPIVDAAYFSLSSKIKPWEKWTIRPNLAYAIAPTVAKGAYYYDYLTKSPTLNGGGTQGSSLGWEFDLGLTFQWDEYFQFSLDNGIFVPGSYYAFSGTATPNATPVVFATSLRVGVTF